MCIRDRYYVKYLFYEILGQIQELDERVAQFIIDNCENPIYGAYLVNLSLIHIDVYKRQILWIRFALFQRIKESMCQV